MRQLEAETPTVHRGIALLTTFFVGPLLSLIFSGETISSDALYRHYLTGAIVGFPVWGIYCAYASLYDYWLDVDDRGALFQVFCGAGYGTMATMLSQCGVLAVIELWPAVSSVMTSSPPAVLPGALGGALAVWVSQRYNRRASK